MFTPQQMLDFANRIMPPFADPATMTDLNKFLDNNDRRLTTSDLMLMQYDNINPHRSYETERVQVPKGTRLRLMGCPEPNSEYAICDIDTPDSQAAKYYLVKLEDTIMDRTWKK